MSNRLATSCDLKMTFFREGRPPYTCRLVLPPNLHQSASNPDQLIADTLGQQRGFCIFRPHAVPQLRRHFGHDGGQVGE